METFTGRSTNVQHNMLRFVGVGGGDRRTRPLSHRSLIGLASEKDETISNPQFPFLFPPFLIDLLFLACKQMTSLMRTITHRDGPSFDNIITGFLMRFRYTLLRIHVCAGRDRLNR